MSRWENRRRRLIPDRSQFWPAVIVFAMLLSACGGGLGRSDAALFSRALGDALQQQHYSQKNIGQLEGSYDPKQVALAQQSGLSNEAVASVMIGLRHRLVATYARDADLQLPSDPMGVIAGSEQLTSLASDHLGNWLVQQGRDRVQAALEDFRNRPDQQRLDDLLKVAGAEGMEYGYFSGSGTFWFRDPVTGKFSAAAFTEHNGERLLISIEGVATRKSHPKYLSITSLPVTITRVDLWRDSEEGRPPLSQAGCCENNAPHLTVVRSIDPNDMLFDPPGFGSAAYIAEDQVISYTIRFENQASALAPATDLRVIADLGTGIDLASVLLGPSSHPAGMTAAINESNGTITWFFKDITLPPNQFAPEGEGWVRFSAKPRSDAASGTLLSVQAAIRFDYNPPVETNVAVHTLDSGPPATRVNRLAPVQLAPGFEISWAGSDDPGGSGLQPVTLLVSEGGGPFSVLGTFEGQTIPFQGETGKTYGFATVGIDQVGHTEAMPDHPDATVTVGQLLSPEPGWQLIGLPVVTDQTLQQLLSRPGTAWSAWDSSEQVYLPVGAGSTDWPVLDFDLPGSGLWASIDAGTSYYITGQQVPVDQPYSIELKAGWNLIANPFPIAVKWDLNALRVSVAGVDTTLAEAQSREWVEDFAWGWNGESYSLLYGPELVAGVRSELEPFKGYWFQAHRDARLILPPPTAD